MTLLLQCRTLIDRLLKQPDHILTFVKTEPIGRTIQIDHFLIIIDLDSRLIDPLPQAILHLFFRIAKKQRKIQNLYSLWKNKFSIETKPSAQSRSRNKLGFAEFTA